MPMTLDRFAAAFRSDFPDLTGRPVLVALSGGADSVALLCLLRGAAADLNCEIRAAHVHHHLRGADADGDAAYCRELCERLAVPLDVEHLAPGLPRGTSPEAWWRRERYRALEAVRSRHGCAAVATAHTRDDQAETVLMKLLRGSGPRGVAGVRRRAGPVVRPLLDVPRAALRGYLRDLGVSWREDASNADPTYPRARLRHEVLPGLEAAFPRGAAHISTFASDLAEDDVFLSGLLEERGVWPWVRRPVEVQAVAALPEPLRRRWVLELARRLPLGEPLSRDQIGQVTAMLATGAPAAVDLGGHWVLRRRQAKLVLSPPPVRPFGPRAVTVPSRNDLPGGFTGAVGHPSQSGARHAARLRSHAASLPLSWRSPLPGERFEGVSVARLLAAAGVPGEWRRAWPVLEAGGTMLWVPGVGVAEGWNEQSTGGVGVELEEPWARHDK